MPGVTKAQNQTTPCLVSFVHFNHHNLETFLDQLCHFLGAPAMLLWPCGGSWINKRQPEARSPRCFSNYPAKVETIISGAMYSGVPSNVCVLPHPNSVEDNKVTNAAAIFLEFFYQLKL